MPCFYVVLVVVISVQQLSLLIYPLQLLPTPVSAELCCGQSAAVSNVNWPKVGVWVRINPQHADCLASAITANR